MKSNLAPFFVLPLVLLVSTSCKKILDEVKKNPGITEYKISKIAYTSDANDYYPAGEYDREVQFNAAGDPVKASVTNESTGNSNQYFFYDSKGNLKKWILYFDYEPTAASKPGDWNVFRYHGFSHDKSGRIATDTIYYDRNYYFIEYYSYDNYDRIVKVKTWYPTTPSSQYETVYSYDAAGNLKGYKYDNKLHFRRLSKVLMFLSRDYSVNNRLQADPITPFGDVFSYIYGKFSLPTTVNGPKLIPDEGGSIGQSAILYQ